MVNDLITRNTSFKLPKGAIKEPKYADQSVEEIYEKILKSGSYKKIKPQLETSKPEMMPEKRSMS